MKYIWSEFWEEQYFELVLWQLVVDKMYQLETRTGDQLARLVSSERQEQAMYLPGPLSTER